MQNTMVCSVKNEGPYLIEWLAYHYIAGFQKFLIVTNDNDDCSLAIMERLKAIHGFHFISHMVGAGEIPGTKAYRIALDYLHQNGWSGYIMVADVDEFIVFDQDISISDFLSRYPDADCVAINWRMFGSSGNLVRLPRLVTERFETCAKRDNPIHVEFKSVFKYRRELSWFNPHYPRYDDTINPKFIFSDGSTMDPRIRREHPYTRHSKSVFGYAQLNHYLVKSREEYLAKSSRGRLSQSIDSSKAAHNRYTGEFFAAMDFNDEVDERLRQLSPAVRALMERIYQKCGLSDVCERSYIGL